MVGSTAAAIVEFGNLFFAGLLAGIELLVRYGVRGPIATLDEAPQIRLRQALVYRMRVLVAGVFVLTALSGIAVTVLDSSSAGFAFRYAGIAAILAWTVTTFAGTVPINSAIITWQADAPPPNWRTLISRWERLDSVRAVAALLAFVFFLTAVASRLT